MGWAPCWDDEYERWYYVEEATGRAQWEAPGFEVEKLAAAFSPANEAQDVELPSSPVNEAKDVELPSSPVNKPEDVELASESDSDSDVGEEEDNLPVVEAHVAKPEEVELPSSPAIEAHDVELPSSPVNKPEDAAFDSDSESEPEEEADTTLAVRGHVQHAEEVKVPSSPAIEPRAVDLLSSPVEHKEMEVASDSDSESDSEAEGELTRSIAEVHATKPEEIQLPSSPAIAPASIERPVTPTVDPRGIGLPSRPEPEQEYHHSENEPEQEAATHILLDSGNEAEAEEEEDEDDYDPLADLLSSPEASSPPQNRERYQRELPHPHPLMMHPVEYSAPPYQAGYNEEPEEVHTPVHTEPVEFWHSPELRYHYSPELRPAEQEFGSFPEVNPEDVRLPRSPTEEDEQEEEEDPELPHVEDDAESPVVGRGQLPKKDYDEWESDSGSEDEDEDFEHDDGKHYFALQINEPVQLANYRNSDAEHEVHQAESVAIVARAAPVAVLGGAAALALKSSEKEEKVEELVETGEKNEDSEESESDEEKDGSEDEDDQVKPVAAVRGDDKQDSEDEDSEFEGRGERERGPEEEDDGAEADEEDVHGEAEAKGTPKAVPEGGDRQRAEDDVQSVSIMNDADTKSLASEPSFDVEPGLDRQDSETIPKAIREGAPMPWATQSKRREESHSPPPFVQRSFSFPDDIADEEAFTVSRSNTMPAMERGGDTKHGEGPPPPAAGSHATSGHQIQHQQTPSAPMSTISDYAHSYNSLPTLREEDWATDDDRNNRSDKDGDSSPSNNRAANITGLFRYGTPIMDPNRDSGFTLSARGSPQMPRYAVFNEQYHQQQLERQAQIKEEDLQERGVDLRDFANSPSAGSDRTETGPSSPLRTAGTPKIQEPVPGSPEDKMQVDNEQQHGETTNDKPEQHHIPRTLPGLGVPGMRPTGAFRSVSDISQQLQQAVSGTSSQSPSPVGRPIPSNTGVARLQRSPEPLNLMGNLRPDSPGSSSISSASRSHTSTPPLRRMDKRAASGNLRSLSFGSQQDPAAKSFLGTLAEEQGETAATETGSAAGSAVEVAGTTGTATVSSPPPGSRSLKTAVSPTTPSRGGGQQQHSDTIPTPTTTTRSGSSPTAATDPHHQNQAPATPSPPRPNTSRATSANSVLAGAGAAALALGTTHLLSTTTTSNPVAGDDNNNLDKDKSKDKQKQAAAAVTTTPRALSVAALSATPVANEGRTRSKGSMDVPDVYVSFFCPSVQTV